MDINKFTEKAQEALAAAQKRASRGGQQQVDVEHLLWSRVRARGRGRARCHQTDCSNNRSAGNQYRVLALTQFHNAITREIDRFCKPRWPSDRKAYSPTLLLNSL